MTRHLLETAGFPVGILEVAFKVIPEGRGAATLTVYDGEVSGENQPVRLRGPWVCGIYTSHPDVKN